MSATETILQFVFLLLPQYLRLPTSMQTLESQNDLVSKGPTAIPCHGQGHVGLNQAAPCPVQPGLGHFRDPGAAVKERNFSTKNRIVVLNNVIKITVPPKCISMHLFCLFSVLS